MHHDETNENDRNLRCTKCDREAVAVDERAGMLCARHATIFITLPKLGSTDTTPLAATGS